MFKIVETVEKSGKQLTIVPRFWETDGQLSWPRNKIESRIKNGESVPEANWIRMSCKVKRNNFLDYNSAEAELQEMMKNDDTTEQEDVENTPPPARKRPRVMFPRSRINQFAETEDNFNNLARNCLQVPKNTSRSSASKQPNRKQLGSNSLTPSKTNANDSNPYHLIYRNDGHNIDGSVQNVLFSNQSNSPNTVLSQFAKPQLRMQQPPSTFIPISQSQERNIIHSQPSMVARDDEYMSDSLDMQNLLFSKTPSYKQSDPTDKHATTQDSSHSYHQLIAPTSAMPQQDSYQYLTNENVIEDGITFDIDAPSGDTLNGDLLSVQKLENILANQSLMIKMLNDNQTIILRQMAKLETMIDVVVSNSSGNNCHTNNKAVNATPTDTDESFDPIESLEQLKELEDKLSIRNFADDLIKKFSVVCGRKGNEDGMNSCFILVDRFFTRNFFTLCSWAGGSRDKKGKIPFKIYKNIIRVFFTIVQLSAEDFTLNNCEQFFKDIIRNSTRRSKTSFARTSKIKRRPGNLKYRIRVNVEKQDDIQQTPMEDSEEYAKENAEENAEESAEENAEEYIEEYIEEYEENAGENEEENTDEYVLE